MRRLTFLIVLAACGVLAGMMAREELPHSGKTESSSVPAAQTSPPMLLAAWHWKPSPGVGIRQAAEAHFDYRDLKFDWNWRWKARKVSFRIDGEWCDGATAARRLQELPVLTWWNLYHLAGTEGSPPEFSASSITAHAAMVADARQALRDGGLSEYRCDRLLQVFDDENFGPHKPSVWAKPDADGYMHIKVDEPWTWPGGVPHAASSAYLMSAHLATCSWDFRDPSASGAGGGSYNITHRPDVANLGLPPYFRATPVVIPGAYGADVTFISFYTHNAAGGTLSRDEALDAIAKAQAPLWLAINNHQPGRVEILRAAKASGKVRLVLFWMPHGDESITVQEARLSQDLLAAELRPRQ
jgi:hypothetical protein